MTPEQLEEIPGIGEKTLERISVAVRHYFGHFEEGEEGAPVAESASAEAEEGAAVEEGSAEASIEEAGEVEPAMESDADAGTEDLVAGEGHTATAGQSLEHESGSEDEAAK